MFQNVISMGVTRQSNNPLFSFNPTWYENSLAKTKLKAAVFHETGPKSTVFWVGQTITALLTT